MKYRVTGYALMPVQIAIEIEANSETLAGKYAAGKYAEQTFESSDDKKQFIVPGTQDECAVNDFRWNEVRPI